MKRFRICAALAAVTMLAGCGTNTPPVDPPASTTAATTAAETTTAAASTTAAETTTAAATTAAETTSAAATTAAAGTTAAANGETPALEGYKLLWSDEFNGDKLDEKIWTREKRQPGWTNAELQEYTDSDENIFVKDGSLFLKAVKTTKDGKDYYTSGKVNSQNKTDFTYGKVVARAKAPAGKGLWPAIWMMPKDEQHYGQWPKCGEIDIMEVLGSDLKTAYCTLHYGEPHAEQQKTKVLTSGGFDEFHEYSVEWEPGEMRWYIDNELILTANDWFTAEKDKDEKPYPAPFDQPFFVQMNLAVGGNWPGDPDANTDFSKAQFEIDYVRVYQKDKYDTNVKKPEAKMREPLADGNYIYNGDFKEKEDLTDDTNWKFLLFEGGEGAAEIKDGQIIITSTKEGSQDYSVQLVQPELPMVKGKKYRLTFDAWADEARDIITCVSAPTAGWIRYLKDTTLSLTTEKKTYTYDFEMTEKNDPNGRLEFNMGKRGSTATVHITNVRVEEVK